MNRYTFTSKQFIEAENKHEAWELFADNSFDFAANAEIDEEQMEKVQDIKHLYALLNNGVYEFCISLNDGLISRKFIFPKGKKIEIENCIDGSKQLLIEQELMDKSITNVGYALSKGALYY